MAGPDIPAAKRAGLPVDLDRMAEEGDGFLTADDRYSLKTHGVCPQSHSHRFMVRVRVPGGLLPTAQARAVARLAHRYGEDWLHLTTRQSLELHWVRARADLGPVVHPPRGRPTGEPGAVLQPWHGEVQPPGSWWGRWCWCSATGRGRRRGGSPVGGPSRRRRWRDRGWCGGGRR